METMLNLSKISDAEILSRLERLVKSERKIMHLILWHLLEVDTRKLYLQLGFESLYLYLTKHLGYSESPAYDRIQAMRILRVAPEVSEKLESGTLTLTQLVKVEQSLKYEKKMGNEVTQEKTKELLLKIENRNGFETQKIIAVEMNQAPLTTQKLKPQKDESVRIELTLTSEQFELLKKAQSLLSHVIPENDIAQLITKLAESYIQKKEGNAKVLPNPKATDQKTEEPAKIAQSFRLEPKILLEKKQGTQDSKRFYSRPYISVKLKRTLFRIAGHTCEHIHPGTQKRCGSRYQLQIDHKVPLAKGGSNDMQNLRVLCRAHNRYEALRWGLRRPLR